MKFVSLMAGIGGIDLGLERAGMECVGQVEIDAYARAVLAKHWPHVRRWEDVRNVEGTEFGEFDLLAAGYPCQPFSHAGLVRSGGDHPSYLWPEVRRIVERARPRVVLLENVVAHTSNGFGRVLCDLAALGFDAEWDCIPAAAVGAPQPRDRLFVVAYPHGDVESVESEHDEASWFAPPAGFPWEGWPAYCKGWGVDDGLPDRVERRRAIGNAVVPQVAQVIGERIMAAFG